MEKKRIIVVGGGFGGVQTARKLYRLLGNTVSITLISDKAYFEYYPALYRIVTGASPIEACVPLENMLHNTAVDIVVDKIVSIDINTKEITGISGIVYTADFLVLALGSQTAYFDLPGLSELSFGFKSVGEAVKLKKHIHDLFLAHEHPSITECVSHFHVVIVGGGASGIEIAGDITYYFAQLAESHNVQKSLITIDLIESSPRLLPSAEEQVSRKIEARLRKLGVNIYLNRSLVKEEIETVYMKDMSFKSKTVIWTAGTRVNSLYRQTNGFSFNKKGKVLVNEYLEAQHLNSVYVLGDAADTPYSGLAQTAIHDGEFIASDISDIVRGKSRKEYKPKKTLFAIPVGDNWGVLNIGIFNLYGILAYWVRHGIDFFYFAGIVSPKFLFTMFIKGWKYRNLAPEGCECVMCEK
jgi:NADH dehydrogenase